MSNPESAVARLRGLAGSGELDVFCRRHHVRVLTLFGSAARGEPDPRDLDVGVLTEAGHPLDTGAAQIEPRASGAGR